MSVSLVAREAGVSASLLFIGRKAERQGALTAVPAGEAVAPASEVATARAEIFKLQGVLGKVTLVNVNRQNTARGDARVNPQTRLSRDGAGRLAFAQGAAPPACTRAGLPCHAATCAGALTVWKSNAVRARP